MKKIFITIICLFATIANAQEANTLFVNGIIHCGNGTVFNNGVLGIKSGKIELVADGSLIKIDRSAYSKVVDLQNQHVYPGFIAMNSSIGLREIDAVRATLDYAETGDLNPHVRTMPAFNTDSKIIPTVRSNGVLSVQATPQNGTIPGASSVFYLEGWNWEDALLKADDGIHLNWPEYPLRKPENDTAKIGKSLQKQQEILKLFEEAKAYSKSENLGEKNLRFEAMRGLFNGTKILFIHCNQMKDIVDAIQMTEKMGIQKRVLVGGIEGYKVTGLLKKSSIPVVLPRLHRLPDYNDQATDWPFRLPSILSDSGVKVILSYDGDMEAMGTRNLGFVAGTAIAYGVDKELALQMITLFPAQAMGIDKLTGSLEVGKSADFFISKGDAFDMRTSAVQFAFIRGKEINLDNHQKSLNQKYLNKYGLQN
jgi:imidazolonepropionase-like amidohydrolase